MLTNMEQCEEDSLTVLFDTPTKDVSTQTNSHKTYTKHAMTSTNCLRSYTTKSLKNPILLHFGKSCQRPVVIHKAKYISH